MKVLGNIHHLSILGEAVGTDLDTANKFIAKLAQLGIVKRSGATVTLTQDLWEDDV